MVLALALAPSALGDAPPYQLAVLNGSSGCVGFTIETTDGTPTGCTPQPDGVNPWNVFSRAASDGSVVFMAQDNMSGGDVGSIWLARPDGSSVHLDDSNWDFDPSISYDGSKIAFARFDPTNSSSDIYTVNSDGSGLQLVVSGGGTHYLRLPSISPDGSVLAYWCGPADNQLGLGGCGPLTDGTYRDSGLMRVNADGTDPRMIVIGGGDALEPVGPTGMSWSPDGQWLALDGLLEVDLGNNESTAQRQIFEYRTDGSDLFNNADPTRQITHETDPWGPAFPQFSPDGSQLLYMEFVDGNGNGGNFTYMGGVDGTGRQELPLNYGAFVPTATPVAPPPLVDATHITVPSVQALDLGTAKQDLDTKNLTVGTVTYQHSATVGKNLVASQDPAAGATAHRTEKQGPPVDLVISLGPAPPSKLCVVPRVKGTSLKTTKRRLTAAHCEVGTIKRAFSRTVRKGHVVAEKPGPGRKLHHGARVALTVSKAKRR
ncbi:MAG TPA: PASTA domain-containing protein [Gaiellaceae bacterium]|nr:PASTA domain-containing protein [Gaiellaceae bacterium]